MEVNALRFRVVPGGAHGLGRGLADKRARRPSAGPAGYRRMTPGRRSPCSSARPGRRNEKWPKPPLAHRRCLRACCAALWRMPPALKYSTSLRVSMRQRDLEGVLAAVAGHFHAERHVRLEFAAGAADVQHLLAGQLRLLRSWPFSNCNGSTPMPTRLERWMRSKLSAITAFTPSRLVPLAAQSRDEPVAVFLAGDDHQRGAVLLVTHGRVVDRQFLAAGHVQVCRLPRRRASRS